jgi:hypothetical protein
VEDGRGEDEVQKEPKRNLDYAKSRWRDLKKQRGKVIVISGKKLQGTFRDYEEARSFSSRFKVALTFVVDQEPACG